MDKKEIDEVLEEKDPNWIADGDKNPEAPASVTVKGYYKGFSVLITNRDPEVAVGPLLAKAMVGIDWMVEKGFKPSWNDDTNKKMNGTKKATETFKCAFTNSDGTTCGADAEYKEGISAKSNKPWKGVFCSAEKEHVKWLR